MEIKIFINNPWQENTIVLYDETKEVAVIDCGCFSEEERGRLRSFFGEKGLKPVVLLNTHLHIDHIFGNGFMLSEYGLSTQAHLLDNDWVEGADSYAGMLGVRDMPKPPPVGKFLVDGEEIRFGNSMLRAIHVPGHSAGSLCYYSEPDQLLIAGDVLFEGSVGRSDLPGGNYNTLLEGIEQKLFTLPDDVCVISGHGDNTTIGREKRTNPFFNR